MAKKYPSQDPSYTGSDLVAQAFVRGAGRGADASHFRSISAQNRALRDLFDALDAGQNPALALYRAAGVNIPPAVEAAASKTKKVHIDDYVDDLAKSKQLANQRKLDGLQKASKARERELQRERALGNYNRGIRGVNAGGNPVAEILLEAFLSRRIDEDRRSAAKLRGTGRRGALSTRSATATGRTNRTGSAATRPIDRSGGASGASGRAVRPGGTSTGNTGGQGGTVRTVSGNTDAVVRDAQARGIMGSSQRLPTATSTSQGSSIWEKILTTAARTGLSERFTSQSRQGTRAVSRQSAVSSSSSSRSLATPTSTMQPQRTSAPDAALLTGSQSAGCNCPKPRREEKKRKSERACRNPVVSKTIRDGFITTKRKLECQPSSRKLA